MDKEEPIKLVPMAVSSIASSDNSNTYPPRSELPGYQAQPGDDQNTVVVPDDAANYPTSAIMRSATSPRPPFRTGTGRTPPPPLTPRNQEAPRKIPRRGTLKYSLYLLMERPTSSSAALTTHLICNSIIALSALLTILETLPFFHAVDNSLWFGLETAIIAIFTIEYMVRCFAWSYNWPTWWNWFTSFFAIMDLLAILPYYIELALRADTTVLFRFSILRTFRLLRAFRPFRYSSTILLTIEVMFISVRRSKDALLALAFFIGMAVIVFSTLLYFAERGVWDETLETFVDEDGDRSRFENIPSAAWFVLVTITTVGYGEIIPRSFLGRLITVPLLLFGLLLVALPSFVLGREFAVAWEEMGGQLLEDITQDPNYVNAYPDSPHTPFTGRSTRSIRSVGYKDNEPPAAPGATGETSETTARHRKKGKARELVFNMDSDDEDHPRQVDADERGRYALPRKARHGTLATSSRNHDDPHAQTNAFMGIGTHRKGSMSISHLPPISLDSSGNELKHLLAEVTKEREALRKEREELLKERKWVAKERELLAKLIGSMGSLQSPSASAPGGP